MKRQIANFGMLLVILATLMLVTVDGYGQTVSIDPASVESPGAGEQLTFNINIAGGSNIAGYELTVTFDPTALSEVSIVNGDYLPEGAFIVPAVVTETSAKLAATAIGATAEGDGTLATVSFTVVEAKASAIGLEAIISDPTATPIAVTVEGGLVTLAAVDLPVEDDENELVGRWNIHTIDGETLAETFGGDEFEAGEVSAISEWTFDADGTWRWITEISFGTDDVVSDSVSWDLGGAYTILGSRYTLLLTDAETIAFFGVEELTGTWGKEGSTLILSYDDGTVMVLQATDTSQPPSPPPPDLSYTFETIDVAGVDFLELTASNDFEDYAGNTLSADGTKRVGFTLIDGVFNTFDYPGSQNTYFYALGNNGNAAGYYEDSDGLHHGVILENGELRQYDFPNAVQTEIYGISDVTGALTGNWIDALGVRRGFSGDTIVEFPGASATYAHFVNAHGSIVGSYIDSDGLYYPYSLTADGRFVSLDLSTAMMEYLFVHGFNDANVVLIRAKLRGDVPRSYVGTFAHGIQDFNFLTVLARRAILSIRTGLLSVTTTQQTDADTALSPVPPDPSARW